MYILPWKQQTHFIRVAHFFEVKGYHHYPDVPFTSLYQQIPGKHLEKWGMDINIVSSTVVRHAGIQVTRVQRLLTTGDILCKSVILQGFPFLQSALV